jgi:hypothetical protein
MTQQRNGWTVDHSACLVWHESGLSISFEGVPGTSHFGGSPSRPEGLSHHRFLALVREGFQLYRDGYRSVQPEDQNQENQNPGLSTSPGRTPVITRRRSRLTLSIPPRYSMIEC